ncbi:MAG: hypothetical protein QOE79_7 [Sphingomonadales bacterium]|nr:hypothetical protein [Sphingomonadales bacterium]
MARPGDRSYRFEAAGHWAAGAVSGFAEEAGGLVAEPPRVARRIPGTGAGTVPGVGPCGRLAWLRPDKGEVFVLHDDGAELQGRIDLREGEAFHPGPSLTWVRSGERLRRFATRSLQELGDLRVPGLVASAADGCDGLWLLTRGANGTLVRWLDARGRLRGRPLRIPGSGRPVAIAARPAARRLAVLDLPSALNGSNREWAVHVVDLATGRSGKPLRFILKEGEAPPTWIVADGPGGWRVASAGTPAVLIGISDGGVETSHQPVHLPPSAKVEGLLWLDGPILDCTDGLYRLVEAGEDDQDAESVRLAFITPTLISPPGTPSGWNRAELDLDLPEGATLTATIFASSSEQVAREVLQALAETADRPAARLDRLEALLEKRARRVRAQTYRVQPDEQPGRRTLHLLLDGITEPFAWLSFEIACPPGGLPVRLHALRARYPDQGWIDDLPAIYRSEPGPAGRLRQFLAPFEALYGDIDEAIDRVPASIHPDTAAADRLSWLLGWLGFPPTAGLPENAQRELLGNAGRLLEERGTRAALVSMLEIVTGARVSVDDDAAAAGFWVVGDDLGRLSPRLGCETRIVSRQPLGFRPGCGMRLGEEPLPPFCASAGRMLSARCGRVRITIALDPSREAVLRPIVESMIAMFVPAHCAIDLVVGRAGRTPPGGRIDREWKLDHERLADPDSTELGCETEAGAWRLPSPSLPPFTINADSPLDGARRLA